MAYLPRFLMSTRPPGNDVYELLVSGSETIGALNRITDILAKDVVNFVAAHGQVDESNLVFVNSFFCEMDRAKVTAEELKKEIETLPFVREVKIEPMRGLMYERYMFPLSSLFAGRVIQVGAGAFAEMEDRLVEIFGSAGETMAYEQGKAYAQSTARDLGNYMKRADAKWDAANVEGLLRAQGWGVVRFSPTPKGYDVTVTSPPPRNGGKKDTLGRFVVGLIVGMLEAYSGSVLAPGAPAYDKGSGAFTFSVTKKA